MSKETFARMIAERIVAARKHAQLSQQGIAELLGISQTKYSKWENRGGKKAPTPIPHAFVHRFCEITGADARDLFRY